MKTALVFLADGFEEIEAVTVIDYLRRAQIEVFTVAVPSKTMQNEKFATGSHNITIQADLTFREFQKKFSENLPDLLYIPGGIPGAPNNASCEDVIQFVKKCLKTTNSLRHFAHLLQLFFLKLVSSKIKNGHATLKWKKIFQNTAELKKTLIY